MRSPLGRRVNPMADAKLDSAFKVAAVYFVAAGTYILASDLLLGAVEPALVAYVRLEIIKGIGFVALTSLLLYALMRRHLAAMRRDSARQAETEQALRRSRDQLARAQQIARLGTWQANLVTGELQWSDGIYEIFGVDPQSFGHTIDAFFSRVHADDRGALAEAQRRTLAGAGPLEAEHRIVRPDGEIRYVFERAEVRTDDRGQLVTQIGTVQDITERKRVELELEERNRQQTAIAQLGVEALASSNVAALMDRAMTLAARSLDVEYGAVLELLPDGRALRLTAGIGWPPGSIGQTQIPAEPRSLAGHALASNEPVVVEDLRTEVRFDPPQVLLDHGVVSGISTLVYGNGSPWGVVGVYTRRRLRFSDADVAFVQALANLIGNVLQREQTQNVIQERNMLRQFASEAAALGGWAYDPGTGVLTWDEEVRRIHEVDSDYQPDAERAVDFYTPRHRDRAKRAFDACTHRGVPCDEELQLVTAAHRHIWVRVIARAERDAQGAIARVRGAIQDISDRKAMESMLHQSQRLEAIGQLTGGIAHDFNNLLTVILGNSEQIARAAGGDQALETLAATTHQAASRGAELTAQLLAYARQQPLEPVPTNVTELLAAMDQLLRRSLGEQVEIELVHGGGLWTAMVDPARLESALLNLCLNARDAMPEGGRLTIETANVHLDDHYAAQQPDITPGHYVMIAVTDTGAGVPPELRERVFEPFFTTKPVGLGSGLGLSMVYGFVKQSRGHVKLYSEPGQGTTVKLYLPRTWDEARPAAPPAPQETERGRGQLVLVVEDDELVRRFVAEQVETLGYRVLTAANGAEALAILESDADVDLLFTDVVMPGSIGGRELADLARNLYPGLPVLFTSGYTENAIVHQGRLDPGIALLNKPYRQSDLARKLAAVLNREPDADT